MTATNEQLSENGVLPKLTLAPKPTGPTVAPRVEGVKTIAEVQEVKEKAINEASNYGVSSEQLNNERQWFDPKTQDCEGGARISSKDISAAFSPATGKILCAIPGKIITREGGTTYKIENKKEQTFLEKISSSSFLENGHKGAVHPSATVWHVGKGHHGAALTSNAGLGGLVKPAGHLAKIVHKVGGEALAMSKALLGIRGHKGE
jgi:hypothetical protein